MKKSKWKGLYIKLNNCEKTFSSPIVSRKTSIIPKFIGKSVKVHNGKKFKEILTTKEMLNHKFGEFFKTRIDFEFKKKQK